MCSWLAVMLVIMWGFLLKLVWIRNFGALLENLMSAAMRWPAPCGLSQCKQKHLVCFKINGHNLFKLRQLPDL